jgi:nucleoside-diphosphate-sugar epimerase
MTTRTCIVTGATGLIGFRLIGALVSDYEVHGVARRPPARVGVTWHALDLATDCDLGSLPPRADAVVYLAQSEHFRSFPDHSLDVYRVNTFNLLRFLEYAWRAGARNFVYASSGGVYGSGDVRMSEEVDIPAKGDLGFYLSTKICSEILAQNYAQFFNVAILRYFFVYGRGQRETMLIPRLIQRVRDGQPILLQGEDGIRTNPTHVSDAVAATRCALDLTRSHTINIGGPEVLSMREIGNLIGQAVGREPVFSVDREAQARHLSGDIDRMRELLGPPRTRFAEGLRTML